MHLKVQRFQYKSAFVALAGATPSQSGAFQVHKADTCNGWPLSYCFCTSRGRDQLALVSLRTADNLTTTTDYLGQKVIVSSFHESAPRSTGRMNDSCIQIGL